LQSGPNADWPKGGANKKRVVRINYGIKLVAGIGATASAVQQQFVQRMQHPRQDLWHKQVFF